MNRYAYILIILFFNLLGYSQSTFPENGAPTPNHSIYAFKNAVIHTDAYNTLQNAVLIVQDGMVKEVNTSGAYPKEAIVYDLNGRHIYPTFIELYSDYGIAKTTLKKRERRNPQLESNRKGAYGWNDAIHSDNEAQLEFSHQKDRAQELLKNGFGVVLSHVHDGIMRGTGCLSFLNYSKKENESMLISNAATFLSFDKGSSTQNYPSSLTGGIALIRQTYYDAAWYEQNRQQLETNISLEKLNANKKLPAIFESNDKWNNQRISKISKEFNIPYILKTGNNDYQRVDELKKLNLRCIVPVNFPDAYEIPDLYEVNNIPYADLKHWEMAPGNLSYFEKNKINFCITSSDNEQKAFLPNLRKAIENGLSKEAALNALTSVPAEYLSVQNKIGKIKAGYYASFFISDKDIFENDANVLIHWVYNQNIVLSNYSGKDIRGNYELNLDKNKLNLSITGEGQKLHYKLKKDTSSLKATGSFEGNQLKINFSLDTSNYYTCLFEIDNLNKVYNGQFIDLSNNSGNCKLFFVKELKNDSISKKKDAKSIIEAKILYPWQAYGNENPFSKTQVTYLLTNANLWTNENDSLLNEVDILIQNGKIISIGKNLRSSAPKNTTIIDCKGKHITPGIIDEHSHIALTRGVNEGTQASSAEVRMGDVINPEDVNIYRQLAGGVTSAQLLHGSANPIGGQSAIIKLRWGATAEEMKFENADGFIKFALGENVKQSNWGDASVHRFPQSRMGVEQVYYDFFTRAKEYDALNKQISAAKTKSLIPRKDIELEALAEIINKKRFITCHSYVQSEINMLMHVADSFGFKVNTFTHILEGYKVADKMKAHGVHASTFSDWWAYKNEVMEAIPYNAAILTKMGVITAINSDDAEMARRLNQEAAKSIKYGGLSEIEALKLVTLNPAKM
ncbi:MAG: amidohydrolase family protein, partial [Bacteroidia bacterium]